MRGKRGLAAILVVSAFSAGSVPSWTIAQDFAAVTGTASVVLKPRPDRMRIRVEVFAQGKTMKEALANLNDPREAIRTQLATLGAARSSIAFEAAQVNSTMLEGRKQMEMMIRARMGNMARKDAKPAATPTVVSTVLTAEWPLKGQSVEDVLLETASLQDAIKRADLAGMKDLAKSSADDAELREELAGVDLNLNQGPGQVQPGTPTVTFLGPISPNDRAKAMAEAFGKAREHAQATAQAAGASLGILTRVDSHADTGMAADGGEAAMAAYYAMARMGRSEPLATPEDSGEAQGSQPGNVFYRVTVTAAFGLK